MSNDSSQYQLVFGNVEGARTAYEFARGSHREFVRSQFQIAFYSDGATGPRMSALDAYQAFGWDRLAEVAEQGVSLLSPDMKTIYRSFHQQLTDAGLGFNDAAQKAGWSDEEKTRFSENGRASFRSIQRLALTIGFDERSIGAPESRKPDKKVAYRMRTFGQENAAQFSTSLKLLLLEAAWIIERQDVLLVMLQDCNILKADVFLNQNLIDNDYGQGRTTPWMRGFKLAHRLREHLGLSEAEPIESMTRLIEDKFGLPVILVNYPGKFAGATIQTNGLRGIVINISGNKGSPLTRRTTLAHELCHILYDGDANLKYLHIDFDEDMADYAINANDEVEKRANAFAIEFLAPRDEVQSAYTSSRDHSDTVAELICRYGVSSGAVRQHIANGLKISFTDTAEASADVVIDQWRVAENSLTDFLPSNDHVPPQRLGNFAYYVALCHKHGLLSLDSSALMLSCDLKHIEGVLGDILRLHPGSAVDIL